MLKIHCHNNIWASLIVSTESKKAILLAEAEADVADTA